MRTDPSPTDRIGAAASAAPVRSGLVCAVVLLILASVAQAWTPKVGLHSATNGTKTMTEGPPADKTLSLSFAVPRIRSADDPPPFGDGKVDCDYPLLLAVAVMKDGTNVCPTLDAVTWYDGSSSVGLTLNASTSQFSYVNDPPSPGNHLHTEMWWITRDGTPSLTSSYPGSGTVTFTYTKTLANNVLVAAGVYLACGVDQQAPFGTVSQSIPQSPSTTAGLNIATAASALIVDIIGLDGNTSALVPNDPFSAQVVQWGSGGVLVGSGASGLRANSSTIQSDHNTEFPGWDWTTADYALQVGVSIVPYAPTAVGLTDVTAVGDDSGALLRWTTGFEVDNLGYRVYRESAGRRVPLSNGLVAGSALSFRNARLAAGYSYAWNDPEGRAGTRYWLESVDLSGRHEWHGPVEATGRVGVPKVVANSTLITALAGGTSAGAAAQRAVRPVVSRPVGGAVPNRDRQGEIAAGDAAKILVREDGWYRVTFQELTDAGFSVDEADARTLHLYADGLEQAIEVVSEDTRDVPAAIEFYGRALDTPFTDGHVYWLVRGTRPGLRIQTSGPSVSNEPSIVSFPYTVEHRERSFYVMGVLNGDRENFWGRFIGADGVGQALMADHIDGSGGKASVDVSVQGLGVAHEIEVSLNGTALGTLSLAPWQAGSASFEVPRGVLVEGANNLRLVSKQADGYSLFDTVRLTYPRWSTADGDALLMSVDGRQPRSIRIDGFSQSAIRAVDITVPGMPVELTGHVLQLGAEYAMDVRTLAAARQGGGRVILAFAPGQVKRAASITANEPSHWRGETAGADVVMITNRGLRAELKPLVELRGAQGYSVAVVDVEDLYDEYNFGSKSAQSIRTFLQEASQRWQTPPKFVVLVGNGTYDPRDYLGLGGDLVPTMHVNTLEMEAPSDDWFVDFDGDGIPNLAIGRLPVDTASEAADVVAKIVAYEQRGRKFSRALLVADKAVSVNFGQVNDQLQPLLPPSVGVENAKVDVLGASAVRDRLLGAIADGVDLVHYAGHGSVDHWSSGLLSVGDAATLSNTDHLVLFTMMNCLNGMFDDPLTTALGRALVAAPNGGAIAVWASSGTTTAPGQEPMMAEFFRELAGAGVGGSKLTLGEAVARAKAAAGDTDVRNTWILLGDPTITLR